jgi:hypothetical protein
MDMPTSLEDWSLLSSFPKAPALDASASRIVDVKIGASAARIKTELFVPKDAGKKKRGDRLVKDGLDVYSSAIPMTALDVAVDGIRVFKQKHVKLHKSGRPHEEEGYRYPGPNLDYRGFYVTVDFRREDSPVLPSRDSIDIDEDFVSQFHDLIESQFQQLLPELIDSAGRDARPLEARSKILRAFSAVISSSYSVYQRDEAASYHSSRVISEVAARVYRDKCPVVLHRSDGTQDIVPLGDVDPSACSVAVASSIAEGRAFSIYAESRKLPAWLLINDRVEDKLLREAWPFEEPLRILTSVAGLMAYIDDIVTEIRAGEIVKLLRGDYALVRSELFSGELYMHVPSDSNRTPRHVGASRSRIEVTSMRPRAVINAEHPLIVRIERHLEGSDLNRRRLIKAWLRSLCDGVIEDSTKQAPMARWETLYLELREIVGSDLPNVSFDSLRVTA